MLDLVQNYFANFTIYSLCELIGTIAGLFVIYFQINQKVVMWNFNVISAFFLGISFLASSVYAYALFQVYYIVTSIYGLYLWKKGQQETDDALPIKRLDVNLWIVVIIIYVDLFFVIRYLLQLAGSDFAGVDAFITASSGIATFLLAKKYLEQWFFWLASDIVYVISIIYYAQSGLYVTILLYGCYVVSAIIGIITWTKQYKRQGKTDDAKSFERNTSFFSYSQCVILCNGQFPTHTVPLSILKQATTVICCDGAIKKLYDFGIQATVIVGDLDSAPKKLLERYSSIVAHNPDQETNDLTKAVEWAVEHGYRDIAILGATGLREDHTLGNISLLSEYEQMGISAKIVTDSGVFSALSSDTEFKSFKGQQVSIFSLQPETPIEADNLQYPLPANLHSWWCGTLNESLGSSFCIKVNDGRIIVFQNFQLE